MAQIYDHRPRTAGAGPGASEGIGVGLGLIASREQDREKDLHGERMAEAKRREERFVQEKSLYDEETEIMRLRIEEAKRISGRSATLAEQEDEAARRLQELHDQRMEELEYNKGLRGKGEEAIDLGLESDRIRNKGAQHGLDRLDTTDAQDDELHDQRVRGGELGIEGLEHAQGRRGTLEQQADESYGRRAKRESLGNRGLQTGVEEEERLAREGKSVRVAGKEAASATFFGPDGKVRKEIAGTLTPEQVASAERWNADRRVPGKFIEDKFDEWAQRNQLADHMAALEEFARRAEIVAGGGPDGDGQGPLADTVSELALGVKADPSPENLKKATLELYEMERQHLVGQRADMRWRQAQNERDNLLALEENTLPDADDDGYEDFIDVLTAIDSSVTTMRHPVTKEIVPKDYDQLIRQLRYYVTPGMKQAAMDDHKKRFDRQKTMHELNPGEYQRLRKEQGGGDVSQAAFSRAHEESQLAGVGGDLVQRAEKNLGGGGRDPIADPPSQAAQGSPTEVGQELQSIREKIESGEFPPLKTKGAIPDDIIDQVNQLREDGAPIEEGAILLAKSGFDPDSLDVVRQLPKRQEAQRAKAEKDKKATAKKEAKKWTALQSAVSLYSPEGFTSHTDTGRRGDHTRSSTTSLHDDTVPMHEVVIREAEKLGIELTPSSYRQFLKFSGFKRQDFGDHRPPPDMDRLFEKKKGAGGLKSGGKLAPASRELLESYKPSQMVTIGEVTKTAADWLKDPMFKK